MSRYKYILFDLDGTLTDPFEGITKSVQYALNAFDIKDEPLEKLKKFIGPPLKESFMEFYGFDSDKAKKAVEKYRERFSEKGIFENSLYPGIDGMLAHLKEAGCVLAIASSKPEVFVKRIVDHFNIEKYFDQITGSFLDGRRTKKSEVVQAALEALHVEDKDTAIMVGDRFHDVEGAREVGLSCIGVSFGYGGREELSKAKAAAIADSVDELEHMLLADPQKELEPLMRLFRHVWRIHGIALDNVTSSRGIYKSQMKMLGYIFHHEGVSQRELATQLQISAPSIAVTAKKLEKMGYIRRHMDEKDNRMNVLNTTAEGRALLGQTWKAFSQVDVRMFNGFSPGEIEQLRMFYERIAKNLEENMDL
ncbi:phosphoglycolate phosphatase-like HAD superfamily hydrolase/DNA-binding MarR family transcriptional regulator [Catenibacillus scindens]|uniref:Phosphoglycolate phosphatase-like HAD superfamily hydrolase/DNA-binding MarR family transcriptional regulator n=1 Tax=Catenibacillus scindens TaxID=673271 RepID=A0A7W8H825_9FIRM|nr:phosphoglycolate phosphatase-like HAD superfamily hydrolase/DNA-binding MarR family transcriptional regulator [Catenibacillus scindens]